MKTRPLSLATLLAVVAGLAGGATAEDASVGQRIYTDDFGRSVRAYLLDNPEVVLEVFTILEAQERSKKSAKTAKAIESAASSLFDKGSPSLGNPEGAIQVVEFFDYQCGYCKSAVAEVTAALDGRDDVRVVLKEFPILGAASEAAARLAMAVRAEHGGDAYIGFHKALMAQKGVLNDEVLAILAGAAGYDYQALVERGNQTDISQKITENRRLAQNLGINGTPAFVFKDEIVAGMMTSDRMIETFDRLTAPSGE